MVGIRCIPGSECILLLGGGSCRFNDLRRAIPEVTQKSLAQTLKRLERNGIVDRVVLDTRPVAVAYSATPLGRSLAEPLEVLTRWATESIEAVQAARTRYDAQDDEGGSRTSRTSRVVAR